MLLIKAKPKDDDILPPQLVDKLKMSVGKTASFGGLVRSECADADRICEMTDLSPAASPAMKTREPRRLYMSAFSAGTPHGFAMHNSRLIFGLGPRLFEASGTQQATQIGLVQNSDKVFFFFGETLFVLPDKKFKRETDASIHAFEISYGGTNGVSAAVANSTVTVSGANFNTLGFAAGDCIRIDVLSGDGAGIAGYYKLSAVSATVLTVKGSFGNSGTVTVKIVRPMPDMAGVCTVGDRVYGFMGNEVFVCEAGNPFNWYVPDPDAPENAPVSFHTGTDTPFTACIAWQGYPTFFKQDRICRLVGRSVGYTSDTARTSSLALSDLPAPGVGAGLAKTLCEVGGALYYCADGGVYRYTGTYPTRVDGDLWQDLHGICAGTDGRAYYLSATLGAVSRLLLYRPDCEANGGWYVESGIDAAALSDRPYHADGGNGAVCLIQKTDGTVWMTRSFGVPLTSGLSESDFGFTQHTVAEFGDDMSCMPAGGRLCTVTVCAKGASGSTMSVKCRFEGDSNWTTLSTVNGTGQKALYRIPVLPRQTGWYRLRLEMTGDWTVSAIYRETEHGK